MHLAPTSTKNPTSARFRSTDLIAEGAPMQPSQMQNGKSRIRVGIGGRLYLDGILRIREKGPLAERIFAPEDSLRFLVGEDLALARYNQPKHAQIYREKVEWMAAELFSEFGSSNIDSGAVFRKMNELHRKAMDGSREFMDFQRSDSRMEIITYYDALQTIGMKSSLAMGEQEKLTLRMDNSFYIGYDGGAYADAYLKGKELPTPKEAAFQLHMAFAAQSSAVGRESGSQYPGDESAEYLMQKAIRHYELAAWHGGASFGMVGDLLPLFNYLGQQGMLLDSVVSMAYAAEKKDIPEYLETILETMKKTSDHLAIVRALRLVERLCGEEPHDISLQKTVQQVKTRAEAILR